MPDDRSPAIPPACTPEQWAEREATRHHLTAYRRDEVGRELFVTSIATLRLYGHPLGFTQEEMIALVDDVEELWAALASVRAKVAALFPGEPGEHRGVTALIVPPSPEGGAA